MDRSITDELWSKTLADITSRESARLQRTPPGAIHTSDSVGSLLTEDEIRENIRLSRARWLEKCINSIPVQVFYFCLSALHCSCYMQNLDGLSEDELDEVTYWVWGTGVPLLVFTVFELLVRISSQGGPVHRFQSWRHFCLPLFHKIELLFLVVMAGRVVMSSYLLALSVSDAEFDPEVYSSDRITVNVLIFYRMMRVWGKYYRVSVKATEDKHWEMLNRDAVWMQEHVRERQKYHEQWFVRLQEHVSTKLVQWLVVILLMIHCAMYGMTRTFDSWKSSYWVTKPTGYTLIACFLAETTVRILAQGGEAFFRPRLHQVEVFFLILGLWMVGYTTWYHNAIRESRNNFEVSGIGTGIVLCMNRFMRFLGIWHGVSSSQWDVHGIWEAQAHHWFESKLGDILEVPPENVKLTLTGDIDIRVRKAKLKPEAFRGIHLPITIRGGLVEDVQVKVPQPAILGQGLRRKSGKGKDMATSLTIKNMLFIVEPGKGLAEAGGLELAGQYWNYEDVLKAKSQLVELMCKLMFLLPRDADGSKDDPDAERAEDDAEQSQVPTSGPEMRGEGSVNGPAANHRASRAFGTAQSSATRASGQAGQKLKNIGGAMKAAVEKAKESAKALGRAVVLKRVEVNIQNVTLQYEDNGSLGRGHVAIGLKVGKIWALRQQFEKIECHVLRVGAYIETQTRKKAQQRAQHLKKMKENAMSNNMTDDAESMLLKNYVPPKSFNGTYASTSARPSSSERTERLIENRQGDRGESKNDSLAPQNQRSSNGVPSSTPATVDPWSTRLSRLLEASPALALQELKCLDVGERLRLWGFDAMDRERGYTSRQHHLRSERWPEQRLVCSLLHLKFEAEPERSTAPAPEAHETKHRKSSFLHPKSFDKLEDAEEKPKVDAQWRFCIDLTPVRIAIDEEQVRCLRSLQSCVKAWFANDHAFRWRPNIPMSALIEKEEDGEEDEATSVQRSNVWHLWWIYATQRVLALQNMQMQSVKLNMKWRETNIKQYTDLMIEVMHNTHLLIGHLQDGCLSWNWTPWQTRWAHELEMRLSMIDVYECRKKVLGMASHKVTSKKARAYKKVTDGPKRIGAVLRRGIYTSKREASSRKLAVITESAMQTGKQFASAVRGGYLVDAKQQMTQVVKEGGHAAHEMASYAVNTTVEAAAATAQDGLEHLATLASTSRGIIAAPELDAPSKTPKKEDEAGPWAIIKGTWEVCIPRVEVRVLRWGSFPRPVLLHKTIRHIDVYANVSATPPESPDEAPRNHLKVTVQVKDFKVMCPQAGLLTLGGGILMCSVRRPLHLGPPTAPSLPDGRKRDEDRFISNPLAFAARIALTNGEQGVCEVHTPDICLVAFEPLVVVLLSYVQVDEEIGGKQSMRLIRRRGHMPVARTSALPFSNKSRKHFTSGLVAKTGRQGPNQSEVTANDTEISVRMATMKTPLEEYCQEVYDRKACDSTKAQKLFKKIVGWQPQGITTGWEVNLNIGALHLLQVGEYGPTNVFVEDIRVRPFRGGAMRGVPRETEDYISESSTSQVVPSLGKYQASMEANGDADGRLSAWDGPGWTNEDGLDNCIRATGTGDRGGGLTLAAPVLAAEAKGPQVQATDSGRSDEVHGTDIKASTCASFCFQDDCYAYEKYRQQQQDSQPSKHGITVRSGEKSFKSPSPILTYLPSLREDPEATGTTSNARSIYERRLAKPVSTFEVRFSVIPRCDFSSQWIEETSQEWQSVAHRMSNALFSM